MHIIQYSCSKLVILVYGLVILSSSLSLAEITIKSIMASHDLKHNNNSTSLPDFANVVYVFEHFLRLIENTSLLVGIIMLQLFMKNDSNVIKIHNTVKHNYIKWKRGIFLSVTVVLAYTFLNLSPIIFYITNESPLSYNQSYSVIIVIILLTDSIKLMLMLSVTTLIRSTWLSKLRELKDCMKNIRKDEEESPTDDKKLKLADKSAALINDYKNTAKCLASLHGVFKHWFVIRWISFFVSMVFHSLLALNLLYHERLSNYFWARSLVLISFITSFIILYFCGSVVNHHHQRYRCKLKKAHKKILFSAKANCFMFHGNFFPKKEKYNFTPSILWINVPLGNPGYIISILLALISFFISIAMQYF